MKTLSIKENEMNAEKFKQFLKNNQSQDYKWLAEKTGRSAEYVRKAYTKLKLPPKRINAQNRDIVDNPRNEKSGVELRGDNVVINWTTKTVITFLGEFGNYSCNFTTHGAIQRAYVTDYEGKGETGAEIATRFDFQHAKAVILYAKHHGFTKSSLGQTDIEFELGLTAEEAAEENIQSIKRKAVKLTEKRKWIEVQNNSDKWNHFENSILLPTHEWVTQNLPTFKAIPLSLTKTKEKVAAVVGVSDWHYLKYCYDTKGNASYNREIAIKKLMEANDSMVSKLVRYCIPEKLFVIIGSDNLHVDNPGQTTTKGTWQAAATDGDWTLELDNYFDVVVGMIDRYATIAPVDVISIPGNHDKHTSYMLRVAVAAYYKNSKRVTVTREVNSRVYRRYGNTLTVFTHGDDLSTQKLQGNIHKFIMAEAKENGVDISQIENYVLYSGHVHTHTEKKLGTPSGGQKDLGIVQHVIFPSLSGEDRWHKESGYIGNKQGALIDVIGISNGRQATFYS